MINHRHKLVFVHVPRTGGESIECFFDQKTEVEESGRNRTKHRTLNEYFDQDPGVDAYFKFAFVRNTWDLMVSTWMFLLTHPRVSRHFLGLTLENFLAEEFPDQLDEVISRETNWDSALVTIIRQSQSHWIDERLDFVGRFEHLDRDFEVIRARTGLRGKMLPHVNATPRKDYCSYYTPRTSSIVANRYADEIQRFGFEY